MISSGIFPKLWTSRKLTNVPLKKGPFHKERFHSLKLIYLLKRKFWKLFSQLPKVGYVINPWRVCLPAILFRGHSLVFGEVTVTKKVKPLLSGVLPRYASCFRSRFLGTWDFHVQSKSISFRWESKWTSLYHFSVTKSKWPSKWTT